jgi:hypothetical protein
VARIRPNEGEAARRDGHVGVRNDLAGMHVYPAAAADHQIGRAAAARHVDQPRRDLCPGF